MYRIRISTRAAKQADRASAWWRQNRDKAPHAFDDDLDEALRLIRVNPGIGEILRSSRRKVRQLWMERVKYFVYYRIREDDIVEILALWHASRGSRPRF